MSHFGQAISYVLFFGVSFPLLLGTISFLRHHGMQAINYVHNSIPVGLGLYFWLLMLLFHFWGLGQELPIDEEHYSTWLLALTIVFIAGWLDDTMGDKKVKGFRGHFRLLLQQKQFSTGMLKVCFISLAAFWLIFFYSDGSVTGLLGTGVVLLMTNAANLLDVRPGRALKGVIFIYITLFAFAEWQQYWLYVLPVWVGMFWVLPLDLKGKVMLGDSGANIIGFSAGCAAVWITPVWFQLILFLCLLWLHIQSEKVSLSAIIERIPVLRWIDQWGRARSRT